MSKFIKLFNEDVTDGGIYYAQACISCFYKTHLYDGAQKPIIKFHFTSTNFPAYETFDTKEEQDARFKELEELLCK